MDDMQNEGYHSSNPRRRQRTQMEVFKETYLPVVLAGIAVILILIFIIGSISRGIQKREMEEQARKDALIAQQNEQKRLNEEAENLLIQAAVLAKDYDYESALAILNTFSGNAEEFSVLQAAKQEYQAAKDSLVLWDDPSKVVNLSFQLLIADPARAFTDRTYSSSFKKNFVTTGEFSSILESLYANNYILVSLDDVYTTEITESGSTIYVAKPLYLPAGKKPLLLTQTNVNYSLYLVDSNDDLKADKGGSGFAHRLVLNPDGSVSAEMVDSNGNTVVGDYDLVPILDKFIEQNPEFSYRGAKAILALTGYNGLFGYRTHADAKQKLGETAYAEEVLGATAIANALRNNGYQLACYTYANVGYGSRSVAQIKSDLSGWTKEVTPILGDIDVLVFAQNSDISAQGAYSGDKYNLLMDTGFRYFLGFCDTGKSWSLVSDNYVRQGRLLVGGANIAQHTDWFSGMFDANVLDSARNG